MLSVIFGGRKFLIDCNFILELNCDNTYGQNIIQTLVENPTKMYKLPSIKRIRIDNVALMVDEVRFLLKYCMPDDIQIMNFNVNGDLIDMGLFIELLCDNIIKKVHNLYLYYMVYNETSIQAL